MVTALLLCISPLIDPAFASQDSVRLYPGIIISQHVLAADATNGFFSHHWQKAESLCVCMRKIEQDSGAVPLSYLLRFAMRSWRILNDECGNPAQTAATMKELDPLRKECLRILHNQHFAPDSRPTRLFLEGGINGFDATLKIRSHPINAMICGLSSVRMLDTARCLAPFMYDVYLGLGIAQCALANEPGIVKLAMHLFTGLHVNLDSGLVYLRTCSQKALYTKEGAQEYLIQFLSPFNPPESAEKQQIFKSLQAHFPGDPYYVFQEIDEDFSFHRQEVFSKACAKWVVPQINMFDTCNFILKRYADLVKVQCVSMDKVLSSDFAPKIGIISKTFSFYPIFLQAATLKYEIDLNKGLSFSGQRKMLIRQYQRLRDQTIHVLCSSGINPMLREYYLWHIDDGLPK